MSENTSDAGYRIDRLDSPRRHDDNNVIMCYIAMMIIMLMCYVKTFKTRHLYNQLLRHHTQLICG